jgi:GH25 family lysozyme M1 (1,4-beta-N-acetylmuramidase)
MRSYRKRITYALAAVTIGSAGLFVTVTAAQALPSGYTVAGIDVYGGNGAINWTTAYNAGIRFAWAKATEGTGYVDPNWTSNYNGARAAGVLIGAYAFGRPDGPASPQQQADYLVSTSNYQQDGLNLPPELDIEAPYSGINEPECWNLTQSQMVSWIRAFVNEVQARTGRAAVIYTDLGFWKDCTGNNSSFGANPLEIANWGASPVLPAGWTSFTAWQYDCSHSVPGSTQAVCQDAWNGSLASLKAFAGGAPPPPPPSGPAPSISPAAYSVTHLPAYRSSYSCPSGELCLQVYDPTTEGTTVFDLYYCRTYSVSNWNGSGTYIDNQTGSSTITYFYDQNHNVLAQFAPSGASLHSYNWDPVWYIKSC